MERIMTELATNISEFKKSPNDSVENAKGQPFAVLTNNKASFYVVPPELFEAFREFEWEKRMEPIVKERMASNDFVSVDLNDL